MTKLEVEEGETEDLIIGPEVAEQSGIEEGQLLVGRNPINQKAVVGKATIDHEKENEKVSMARTLFESIGLDAGFDIEVEPYEKNLKKLKEVEFAVEKEGDSEQDPLASVKEDEKDFLSFVGEKTFTKHSQFLWHEKDLLVSLKETVPELKEDEAAELSELEDFRYTWGGSGLKSFNGVLLIDTSGSMETPDLKIENIRWVLERISKGIEGDLSGKFLDRLKGKKEIERSKGAAFCALMYLVQKIGRGVGDKIAVIPFSTDASPIRFQNDPYFSASGNTEDAAEKIIDGIKYATRGHTNLSLALQEAIEVMKDFERDKMKMIVVLTDGKPNPPSVDDSQKVIMKLEENLAPRKDVVVNTIGLGAEVDHHLMDRIARKTGGEYTYVTGLQGLSEAYSRYATSISVKGTSFFDRTR